MDSEKRPSDVIDICGPPVLPAFDFMAVQQPPTNPKELENLGVFLDDRLTALFAEELPSKERRAWGTDHVPDNLWAKFDEFIIRQARTYGLWRLMASRSVRARIADWESWTDHGPELLERFFEAVVLCARVRRGQAKFPVTDPALYAAKKYMVPELRLLLNQYKREFKPRLPRDRQPSYQEVRDWFEWKITKSADVFPNLRTNLSWLLNYFEYIKRQRDETRFQRIALGYARPAELFNAMVGCSWNRSEEDARQAVSQLGSLKL